MNDFKELTIAIEEITSIAKGFGLNPYPMRYEICPSDIINTFGAYGMPTRYSHWSFGKAFYKLKLQYDLGLSKIYELVINSNPSYAFLLKGNTMTQNKLIVAHVLAHSDFFNNNIYFSNTSKDMVESMARTAKLIRVYEFKYGKEVVENFIDSVLTIQEHVDPYLKGFYKSNKPSTVQEKDLLLFIMEYSKSLIDWQRDILGKLREEMLYFWPQIETKIMNEGWAVYWHTRILREMELNEEETIEFAKLNASIIKSSKTSINPYYLGLKIFENIEKSWGTDKGTKDKKKIYEVRELENDISFIRNYLTDELIEEMDLYLYQKKGDKWIVIENDQKNIRNQLIREKINGGYPYIIVQDGDFLSNGELYLAHKYDGLELDIFYLEKTLTYIYKLWGKMVHLETTIENRIIRFSYDGTKAYRKFL